MSKPARYEAHGRKFDVYRDGRVISCEYVDSRGARHLRRKLAVSVPRSDRAYPTIYSSMRGVRFGLYLHRVLAECFLPREEGKNFVNHKDGNKRNFALENLEWSTSRENCRHAIETGLWTPPESGPGMKSRAAKLTDACVRKIKRRIASGESNAGIARDYPVGSSAIGEIRAGRSWAHISLTEGV